MTTKNAYVAPLTNIEPRNNKEELGDNTDVMKNQQIVRIEVL